MPHLIHAIVAAAAAAAVVGAALPLLAETGATRLEGKAAFGDWRLDKPGTRRVIRPQDLPAAFAFGSEYVAVGRHANEPLMRKPGGEQGDLEASRNGRFLLLAAAHRIEKIGCRTGLIGGREVLRPDQPPRSRFIQAPIAESGFAF